jgi:hypothetical protein
MTTETIFILDLVGWFAVQDFVCEQHDFVKSEATQLEPWPLPDGRFSTSRGPRNPPLTSPNKSVINLGAYGPRHISTAEVTLHRSPKQADFLQKFNGHSLVSE